MSKGVKPLSSSQHDWACRKISSRLPVLDRGLQKYCTKCGYVWREEEHTKRKTIKCPHCGKTAKRVADRSQKGSKYMTFCILERHEDIQLIRVFEMFAHYRMGNECKFVCQEVVRSWISKDKVVLETRTYTYYSGYVWGSDMKLRGTIFRYEHMHDIISEVCPYGKSLTEYYKLRGIDRLSILSRFFLYSIDNLPILETALKLGYQQTLSSMIERGVEIRLESQLRIAIRHGYKVKDWNMWIDMIMMLERLGKDIRNPLFILPKNLKAAHDLYMENINRREEKRRRDMARRREIELLERNRKEQARINNHNEEYIKKKGKYLNRKIESDGITITPIQSVDECREIGHDMHICIFSSEYYRKDNTLLLVARKDKSILAVMEIALKSGRILQSRAKYNDLPENNDQLIHLAENNSRLILHGNNRNKRKQ